jgi:hypothetical protein
MLPRKKVPVEIGPSRLSQKQLEDLYARRSAIDALIASLEEYNRFRSTRIVEDKRKLA